MTIPLPSSTARPTTLARRFFATAQGGSSSSSTSGIGRRVIAGTSASCSSSCRRPVNLNNVNGGQTTTLSLSVFPFRTPRGSIKISTTSSLHPHTRRTFATDTTTTAATAAATDGTTVAASDGSTVSPEVDYKVFTPKISPDEVLDNGEGDVIDIPDLSDTGLDYPLGSSADIIMERCIDQAAYYNYNMGEVTDPWKLIDFFQSIILRIHDATGCSWAAAIMGTALVVRTCCFPLILAATRARRKRAALSPMMAAAKQKMDRATQNKNEGAKISAQREYQKLMIKQGTGKIGQMYSVLSIPLFITASVSIRNFSFRPWDFPSFALDSPLHLDSLALADPLCVLPLYTVGILLTQIEIFGTFDGADASKSKKEQESEEILNESAASEANSMQEKMKKTFQKFLPWLMRGGSCILLFRMELPAGIFLYISTNTTLAFCQNCFLRSKAAEWIFNLPPNTAAADKIAAVETGQVLSKRTQYMPCYHNLTLQFFRRSGKMVPGMNRVKSATKLTFLNKVKNEQARMEAEEGAEVAARRLTPEEGALSFLQTENVADGARRQGKMRYLKKGVKDVIYARVGSIRRNHQKQRNAYRLAYQQALSGGIFEDFASKLIALCRGRGGIESAGQIEDGRVSAGGGMNKKGITPIASPSSPTSPALNWSSSNPVGLENKARMVPLASSNGASRNKKINLPKFAGPVVPPRTKGKNREPVADLGRKVALFGRVKKMFRGLKRRLGVGQRGEVVY